MFSTASASAAKVPGLPGRLGRAGGRRNPSALVPLVHDRSGHDEATALEAARAGAG